MTVVAVSCELWTEAVHQTQRHCFGCVEASVGDGWLAAVRLNFRRPFVAAKQSCADEVHDQRNAEKEQFGRTHYLQNRYRLARQILQSTEQHSRGAEDRQQLQMQ
jgi:hypothetical protein